VTPLKNHVDAKHVVLNKFFEEEVNSSLKKIAKKQPTKKWLSISSSFIFNFFIAKRPFKECDVEQQQFVMDLCLLVVKNNLPI
jgi:hypothetical protein